MAKGGIAPVIIDAKPAFRAKKDSRKVVISKAKLKAMDVVEVAKFHYLVNPKSFSKLAELQGVLIEDLKDVVNLAEATRQGLAKFNFGRLYRTLKHTAGDLKRAEATKIIIK